MRVLQCHWVIRRLVEVWHDVVGPKLLEAMVGSCLSQLGWLEAGFDSAVGLCTYVEERVQPA
jgi:hypothetical protein